MQTARYSIACLFLLHIPFLGSTPEPARHPDKEKGRRALAIACLFVSVTPSKNVPSLLDQQVSSYNGGLSCSLLALLTRVGQYAEPDQEREKSTPTHTHTHTPNQGRAA
jgi:hypothetical protein